MAVLCALLAVELLGGGYYVYTRVTASEQVIAAIRAPTTGPKAPPAPGPTAHRSVGLVVIDPAVTDPRAVDLAAALDAHFTGINNKDYGRALSVYDPAGVINPNDPAHANRFRHGVSTTVDTDIVLRSVSQAPNSAALLVQVTFRSQQQPGFGPKGRENEQCTRWDVTHEMSVTPPATYRILRSVNVTSASC